MFLEALSVSLQEMSHQAGGHSEISFVIISWKHMHCSSSRSLFLFHSFFLSLYSHPWCRWYCACFHLWSDSTWFIWQAFNPACACPSASDRKHPRASVSATKSGSLSFNGYNLQPECTPTNHIYFCTLELHRVRSGAGQCLKNIELKQTPRPPNGYGMVYCTCIYRIYIVYIVKR